MHLKTKKGRSIELPTDAEDAEINAGIKADPDTLELDSNVFAHARPAAEVLMELFNPEIVGEMLGSPKGRPPIKNPKKLTSVRFDPDILDSFKATGKGWQTRMNDALREWLNEHPELSSV
ncbi:MAG: BrnA antitoxin family protein [Methylococcales bacterium]|nr:BrnA antitoxin family protein [Methylococcales bacterium]